MARKSRSRRNRKTRRGGFWPFTSSTSTDGKVPWYKRIFGQTSETTTVDVPEGQTTTTEDGFTTDNQNTSPENDGVTNTTTLGGRKRRTRKHRKTQRKH